MPELNCNLFSVTSAIQNGCALGNQDNVITLTKGEVTLQFDRILNNQSGGYIGGIIIEPFEDTSKEKQKNDARTNFDKSTTAGFRIYMDISSIHANNLGGEKY